MPLGFERINEREKRPNELINFIRPLPGKDEALSKDFLERVAAICYPVMKANHIAVMALEEYPANLEFIGRNFNAGEVIQLVLKAPHTGQWLSFRSVQMVMMHELAHCKQMNHSKFFWKVRDQYASELRELWAKQYTGEGLWGKGRSLETGRWMNDSNPDAAAHVESLCGGTYRSQRGKRKRKVNEKEKPKVSYAERQQRRILKKFGRNGVTLGDNENVRAKLEAGKKPAKGKPRVAGSNRGRELRAAAALARFEQSKSERGEELSASETETETEYEYEEVTGDAALNINGKKLLDGHGHGLVKVCEEEDSKDENARREMAELNEINHPTFTSRSRVSPRTSAIIKLEDSSTESEAENGLGRPTKSVVKVAVQNSASLAQRPPRRDNKNNEDKMPSSSNIITELKQPASTDDTSCPICSLANDKAAVTCAVCSHVLKPDIMNSTWQCPSSSCRVDGYLNAGDCGICGACGASKSK